MSVKDDITNHNHILKTALTYRAMGFSIIPLQHDSKLPATRWSEFQHRLPTENELTHWFTTCDHTGFAVVTGNVSRLLVLDFDNPTLYNAFCQSYPDLANTLVVRTRRGYHLYYRVPPKTDLQSRKLDEIDVQYEGRYVVGSRTIINDHQYHIVGTPCLPKYLGELSLSRLCVWMDEYEGSKTNSPTAINTTLSIDLPTDRPFDDLAAVALYHKRAIQVGRNNALFQVASLCRDHGWWADKTLHILGPVHVRAVTPTGHRSERHYQRQLEAERTINSAYNYPRRRIKCLSQEPASYLSNAIREKLTQLGLTAVLRVLEGLALAGIQPETSVCYSDLMQILPPMGIGNHSIRKALNASLSGDISIFCPATSKEIPPITPQKANAATSNTDKLTKNVILSINKNRQKVIGRPAKYYIVPSEDQLGRWLEVKINGSDPIKINDIKNVVAYRSRLHRTLIERRPGQYSRKWLSGRLGVCVQTIRSYDLVQNVKVVPVIKYIRLFWHNLTEWVPRKLDQQPGGIFLHCEGTDYPLKYEIAQTLLKQKKQVYFARQETNFYTTETNLSITLPLTMELEHKRPESSLNIDAINEYHNTQRRSVAQIATNTGATVRAVKRVIPKKPTHHPQGKNAAPRSAQLPSPKLSAQSIIVETWITRVYMWINTNMDDPTKQISRATLQLLIADYGLEALQSGFATLKQRQGINNPAGWLRVFMRSECVSTPQKSLG